jgi:hypothetical protein
MPQRLPWVAFFLWALFAGSTAKGEVPRPPIGASRILTKESTTKS